MFLSNRDIKWGIQGGRLIFAPPPEQSGSGYDETSVDLHLDHVNEAKVWDITALLEHETNRGGDGPELKIGKFRYAEFAEKYLIPPSSEKARDVYRRGDEVVIKPGGFLLWQTKEKVGTPTTNPGLISFVNAKSTRARTGLIVHMTAPTIHAGWSGNITLEIANLGRFHFVLEENDVIAQLTVAGVSSPPDLNLKVGQSVTQGQEHVTAKGPKPAKKPRGGRRTSS